MVLYISFIYRVIASVVRKSAVIKKMYFVTSHVIKGESNSKLANINFSNSFKKLYAHFYGQNKTMKNFLLIQILNSKYVAHGFYLSGHFSSTNKKLCINPARYKTAV